jgi:PleD family two-component response regulator
MSTVLVVEDHVDTASAFERILRHAGFEVVVCYDGIDALEVLKNKLPATVILDCLLPGMSGCEVLEAMQRDERMRGVPVIMFTSDITMKARDRAMRLGAREFVVKGTVGWDELVLTVKKYAGEPGN